MNSVSLARHISKTHRELIMKYRPQGGTRLCLVMQFIFAALQFRCRYFFSLIFFSNASSTLVIIFASPSHLQV